jgi:predicted dinucleotide-binding enzyme
MTMKQVGVLGSGVVGQTLADGFLKHGYRVMRGTREPQKLQSWMAGAGPHASLGSFHEAAQFGEIVVLAVKGGAAIAVLDQCGDGLAGKTVIDTTNPIADAPPDSGVLKFFTNLDESLLERLQRHAPKAHFVKAFSCVGNAFMVNPDFGGQKPTMFMCGNHSAAKEQVQQVLLQFGWDIEDLGTAAAARAIEPLCILWCIPGLTGKGWNHAYKVLRK